MQHDVIIIGSGITGATLAERYANVLDKNVLVLEKREHIGGNCFDYLDEDGILVQKYGPHYFHTNYGDVWEYVSQFATWIPYEHRVLSYVDGKYVPIPVNIDTVNMLFDLNIEDEGEMRQWLAKNVAKISHPENSEESALARVGPILYEKMFKNYTLKQWDMHPRELDPSVMERIPIHLNRDDRYFTDRYQGIPRNGFTGLFQRMLDHPNIQVHTNTDFFDLKAELSSFELMFYTGPIDLFFDYCFGQLQYRSLRFEFRTLNQDYYQPKTVINFPNEYEFTRIHEPKHATQQNCDKTTIITEYSAAEGEPYYPVPSKRNRDIYRMYAQEAAKLNNIYFIGRLAAYGYINMDQGFKHALDLFNNLAKEG